jgi:hypothetical protein
VIKGTRTSWSGLVTLANEEADEAGGITSALWPSQLPDARGSPKASVAQHAAAFRGVKRDSGGSGPERCNEAIVVAIGQARAGQHLGAGGRSWPKRPARPTSTQPATMATQCTAVAR